MIAESAGRFLLDDGVPQRLFAESSTAAYNFAFAVGV
jgi:hypothetical protein